MTMQRTIALWVLVLIYFLVLWEVNTIALAQACPNGVCPPG